jgi:plasmid stabilization system protein ParE
MASVFILPAAQLEIREAFDWYETQGAGLGRRFLAEVYRQIDRLADHPAHFPMLHKDIRRARLRVFPYGLFFREMSGRIYLIACCHSRRDPMVWRDRA